MAITLKDIAEELGVSVTTVSRALSGRGRIRCRNPQAGDGESRRAGL